MNLLVPIASIQDLADQALKNRASRESILPQLRANSQLVIELVNHMDDDMLWNMFNAYTRRRDRDMRMAGRTEMNQAHVRESAIVKNPDRKAALLNAAEKVKNFAAECIMNIDGEDATTWSLGRCKTELRRRGPAYRFLSRVVSDWQHHPRDADTLRDLYTEAQLREIASAA